MNKTKATNNGASFGKIMMASAVGVIIAGFVLSMISMIFMFVIAASATKKAEVQPQSVLIIKLNNPIVEQQPDDFNFDFNLFGDLAGTKKLGLNKILSSIKSAKNDDNIKGIFLNVAIPQASMSELKEIRDALADFKTSGKFIIAHSDMYSPGAYYIATVADKIYLTPTGLILWKGMAAQVMYYKDMLDKLGVQVQVIRHGKFKSAVEPFMLDTMSHANREQLSTLLNTLWDEYVQEIADARNLDVASLNTYADKLMLNSDKQTVALGFVDDLKYHNDVVEEIKNLIGIKKDKKLHQITLAEYIDYQSDKEELDNLYAESDKSDKIAIIYAEGQIIDGKSNDNSMGSITISQAIRKAADDETVKAIVLRVNSPGGSALASEVIWHEVNRARQNKPVIVSMGRYAASGGYYISCDANKIFAEPYTITGSIGVFGMVLNTEQLVENKLGININVVKTNENADFGNVFRPLSETEHAYIQTQIEDIYDTFITRVADGRGMTKEAVDSIGQGRVWAAEDALKIGLVDEIGSIQDAIDEAAKQADLKDYKIIEYPKVKNFIEQILDQYETSMMKKKYGILYETYEQINRLQYMQGIQAIMPYEINIVE